MSKIGNSQQSLYAVQGPWLGQKLITQLSCKWEYPLKNTAKSLILRIYAAAAGTAVWVAAPTQILASSTGGSLPWDAPLQTLAADLTGPVATAISIIALFVAGAILVFGEDLSHFVRRALMAVIAIAFLVLGAKFLTALGLAGATV